MNENTRAYVYWRFHVIPQVLVLKPHVPVAVPKKEVLHPRLAGFKRRSGALKGQIADYGLWISNREIHVEEYGDRYEVHWDEYNPKTQPIEHLLYDSPEILFACIAGTLIGAVIGEQLSQNKRAGRAIGTGIGFFFGIFIGSALSKREPAIFIRSL